MPRSDPYSACAPRALVFDAYGTLFDVFSVTALCEQLFPGNGAALATLWRAKQLQYSLLRSMMNRYKDFWQLTQDGLAYAAQSLKRLREINLVWVGAFALAIWFSQTVAM